MAAINKGAGNSRCRGATPLHCYQAAQWCLAYFEDGCQNGCLSARQQLCLPHAFSQHNLSSLQLH